MDSVQVGNHCYATAADAAAAACAGHTLQVSVQGGNVVALSCHGYTDAGAMVMETSTYPVGDAASAVVTQNEIVPVFQPCQEGSYVAAGLAVFAAVLVASCLAYGPYKIIQWLRWGRGDAT